MVGYLAHLCAYVEDDDSEDEDDHVRGGRDPEHFAAPEDEVGGREERHSDRDDPSRAELVGEASGDRGDEGACGSDDAEASCDAGAHAIVVRKHEGECGPEAAEGGED